MSGRPAVIRLRDCKQIINAATKAGKRWRFESAALRRLPHCYFRYRGERWRIPAPGTEGFATAYDKLLAHIKANPFRSSASVDYMPGSLGWAIEKFLASPLYTERAETTKVNYRRVLGQLRDRWGTGLLAHLEPRHIRTIRNEIGKTSTTAADIAMSLLSTLWNFAVEKLDQDK